MTALEEQRENAALGAAFRRAMSARPEGWRPVMLRPTDDDPDRWYATSCSPEWFEAENDNDAEFEMGTGATPTIALTALADALEGG